MWSGTNRWLRCIIVLLPFLSYYVFHISLNYAHILFLYVSINMKLKRRRIYNEEFMVHTEPTPELIVFSVDVTLTVS